MIHLCFWVEVWLLDYHVLHRVSEWESVCEWVRERVCVWVSERERVCVSEWERVCVCEWERVRERVSVWESVCVWLLDYHVLNRVSEWERESVCVWVSEWERVCEWVRERVCVSARLPRCTFTILEDVHLYILVYVYATCIHFFFQE